MKKWIIPIAVLVVCVLAGTLAMPISLAAHNTIKVSGKLLGEVGYTDRYVIGRLHAGDKVKVVITDLRGDGDLVVYFSNSLLLNPFTADNARFSFPGDVTFSASDDGDNYYLMFWCKPFSHHGENPKTVIYRGYVEW